MNHIEKLLHTLAPKGVGFRKLGEVLEYDQPNKYCVTSKEFDKSYPTPVLTAGKTFILGYTNEKDNIYQASKSSPVIIFDDFTTATQWVDFPFKVKSSAMKILLPKNPTINIRFIFFYMQTIPYNISGEHTRQWISRYSQLEVPIPPLEIQQKIVKILDAFTELNTELKARKKQYQYYQNMLLDFNDINQNRKDAKISAKPYPKRLKTLLQTLAPKGVGFRKLGEVCEIIRGKRVTKKEILDKGKYPVVSGGIGFMGYLNEYNREENTITIAQYGTAGFVNWQNQKFWANDVCFSVIPKETLINRYLYYVLTNMQNYLYSISNRSAIPYSISSNNIMQITIPIPPLEIQQEIVKILDQFSLLTTDLLAGIPAEIKARKKQYEYYREKLLTFKPLTPNKEVKA
ncbi:restriction endonuclease subunit S [Helicobacter pylori]|uniref:restriction endonuclease subunit S n=1 Tax=Helicobacter pylori TaxID=210 RepID=UPI000D3C27EB|nr:restriction endonuclease subunit S [Helicobacter pylori]PUD52882.1 restriction endonuclease subunit S [Helicobacter pylori]WRG72071.1 restriction endonuclease subunit S [Helicobacter pylori]WRG77782.1 restriction endonuclease subunit S [Helicobacter pylori]